MTPSDVGAILLAGGRATRMDGVAKTLLDIGGRSMLQRAIDACLTAGCVPITVVGPAPDAAAPDAPTPDVTPPEAPTPDAAAPVATGPDDTVVWIREDPPFSGPAAAVVTALSTWDPAPEWTFVLACDLPRVDAAVAQLSSDMVLLPSDTDGMCLGDASSRPQWLTGVYRTRPLMRAAAEIVDGGRNAPMRALVADLAIAVVATSGDITQDVDTWEDLERARASVRDDGGGPE